MNITFLKDNVLIEQKVALFLQEWDNNQDFFNAKTSGSTGKPKNVTIKKEHAIQSCKNTAAKLNLLKKENALLCLDLDTIGGKMMLIRSIILNLNLFVTEPSANPLLDCTEKIDFIALVPLQLQAVLNEDSPRIRAIKNVIIGGGVISNSLQKQLKNEKITVFQTYGMTETISHIALRKLGEETEECFETLSTIEISSEEDRLKINAPLIGVHNLLTNDMVEIKDSKHFKWIGRADFVVNSGGVKLHPEQLTQKLEGKIPESFFISGTPDEKLGQKLIIVIQSEVQEKYCFKKFYSSLGKYEIPKEAWFISNFSFTASAKINQSETLKQTDVAGIREVL